MTDKETIRISRDEWEKFLATVKALIRAHTQLLDRSRKLKAGYDLMEKRVRKETKPQRSQPRRARTSRGERKGKRSLVAGVCSICGREIREDDKYCDSCGRQVAL